MENNNLLKERAQILEQMKRLQAEQGKDAVKLDDTYIKLRGRLEEIVGTLKTFVENQNKLIQSAITLEKEAKSLGTIYSTVSNEMRTQSVLQKDIANSIANQLTRGSEISERNKTSSDIVTGILSQYNEQSSIAKELAQLTSDDIVQKAELEDRMSSISEQIQEQVNALDKRTNVAKEFLSSQGQIESSIESQVVAARDMASLTQEQKDILEEQADVFDSIKKKVSALGSTLTTFLQRPQAAIGALVIATGTFANKFGDMNKELGQSFLQGMNASTASATALGFVFDDTAGTVKALASEFGDVSAATFQTQANVGLIAANMGISNTQAVGLMGSFARLNGGSAQVAADMIKTTQEFAKQNGIIPSEIMADLANSTEAFALYGKAGGKNILEAAGYAAKLGVNMNTLTGIADNLLNFESSITKELELSALLGKNINLNQARQLAYAGDIKGATAETLRQLGGIDTFNKMDYFQKKASADLLGVSVAELEKMATNQANANTMGAAVNETFSAWGETLNMGLNKYLGTGLQGIGGMITLTGQLGTGFKSLGLDMGDIVKKSASFLGNLVKMGAQKVAGLFGGGATDTIAGSAKDKLLTSNAAAATSKIPQTSVADKVNKTTGGKGMNVSNMLKGAAAILILSAALFVAAKAFQEFGDVEWPAVTLGLAGLAGMATIALVLGKAQGEMIKGAIGVAILGVALIPFAYAMSLIAGLDIGSVISAAAGLVVFSAAVFGLGTLMMTGVGAFIFGAGLLALAGLGAAMMVLGAGLLVAGTGFQAIGNSMGSIISTVSQIGSVIGEMFQYIVPIAALSLALGGLALALTAVGVAGIAALPGLMAVAAVGTIAMGVGSLLGFGGGEGGGTEADNGMDELLTEIKGLRADLNSGKVAVYMDGKKVSSSVNRVMDKIGTNFYGAT